jgi:tetratricopeptide (TPR) repeat protein
MLQWLEEGDRMADAPPGTVARPSSSYVTLGESSSRRSKFVIGGVIVLAAGFVLALRLTGSGKSKADEQAAATTSVAPRLAAAAPVPPPAAPAANEQAVQAVNEQVAVAPAAAQIAAEPAAVAAPAAAAPGVAAVEAPAPAPAAAPPPEPAAAADVPSAGPSAALAAALSAAPPPAASAKPVPPPAPVAAPAPAAPPPVAAVAPKPVPVAPARPTVAMAELQHPAAAVAAPAGAVVADNGAYDQALSQCRAFMTAGKIKNAVASCRQATEARPNSPEALTLLAEAEYTRGHTGVALKLATEATAADQNFADAYVIIGGVYQDKGKGAEARAAYEQYLALQPKGKHASDLRAILGAL